MARNLCEAVLRVKLRTTISCAHNMLAARLYTYFGTAARHHTGVAKRGTEYGIEYGIDAFSATRVWTV